MFGLHHTDLKNIYWNWAITILCRKFPLLLFNVYRFFTSTTASTKSGGHSTRILFINIFFFLNKDLIDNTFKNEGNMLEIGDWLFYGDVSF